MLDKSEFFKKALKACNYISGQCNLSIDTAVILGSGLGGFIERLNPFLKIQYSDIPHFPLPTAPEHKGNMYFANSGSKNLLIMQGRFHYYEGYSMDEVVFPIRVMKLLGIKNIILTNAAGAVNETYSIGDLMLICDHIKFFNDTPLRGENLDSFGPRFNDMSDCYTKALRDLIKDTAEKENIPLKEGIYSYMPGPCYETPAEIRMLRALGADAVGMSTVPEAICACHAGMKVVGISFITNMAAGICDKIEELTLTDDALLRFSKLMLSITDKI